MKLRLSVNVWLLTCPLFLLMMSASAAPRQVMHSHVPAVVAGLMPTGNFAGTNHLNLAIGLPLRNKKRSPICCGKFMIRPVPITTTI